MPNSEYNNDQKVFAKTPSQARLQGQTRFRQCFFPRDQWRRPQQCERMLHQFLHSFKQIYLFARPSLAGT